tara:strand:- start:3564 stop:5180 length:1617 start_codon:yes stop_codon:yes gene_type:complete
MKTIKKLNGSDLLEILVLAKDLIYKHKDQINQLNVFPVPDGDTGTNMYLTLEFALKNVDDIKQQSIDQVSRYVAKNAVLGGRGNSGVILSQILQGLSHGLNDIKQCDVNQFGNSLESAVNASYKSVSKPVEGTMLTIIKAFSDSWNQTKEKSDSFSSIIPKVCESTQQVLLDTPNMLKILKEAGVVDAGGQGLIVIFEAMKSYLCEQEADIENIMNTPNSSEISLKSFVDEHSDEEWGYCVQFVINGSNLSHDLVKNEVNKNGGSTVITGIDNYVKVHTHSEDPGSILTSCITFGDLMEINIENMDKQFEEFSKIPEQEINENQITSVVAISNGKGFDELFMNIGVDAIVSCKNTINPSVEEILDKIDKCNSSDIILLPNDKNAIMSCEIAIQKSKKNVSLIKTLSVSEGLTSMIVFNNEVDISSNIESMQEYIKDICFISISTSSRSGSMNNTIYKEGDYITISDGDIVLSESDLFDSITKTIEFMNPVTDSYLTIYWGNIEDTNVVEKKLSSHYENIDIEFQKGGQQNFVASLVLE